MNIIQEIFATLKHNKLRTFLTGLSVSWGIFILIVLLGAGNGLRNGVKSNFNSRAVNSVQIWAGKATIPYQGLQANRWLSFKETQLDVIKNNIPEAQKQTGIIEKWSIVVSNKGEYGQFDLKGVSPDFLNIFNLQIESNSGRFINELDLHQLNKVVVLDKRIEDVLFKGSSALGKYVKIGSIMFKVVGINSRQDEWGSGKVYIPFTTAQAIYNPSEKFNTIAFTINGLETEAENEAFNNRLKAEMGKSMFFDAKDPQGLWIRNSQQDYIRTQKIFNVIDIILIVIGVLTLIAGIVGISNIMLVSVKERTREIGIRKAIGAPPSSILFSVIMESILITAIFGYVGLVLGVGLTEGIASVMAQNTDPSGMSIFKDPTINVTLAFVATLILIVAGVIAGYIPARRAVKIKPIEAMREE